MFDQLSYTETVFLNSLGSDGTPAPANFVSDIERKSTLDTFMKEKARYWALVAYAENMIDNWESVIADRLQVPCFYAVHDKDIDKEGNLRKTHVHINLVFPNTTTRNAAITLVNQLSKPGCRCCSTAQVIVNIRSVYEYAIHNTEGSKHKYQYPESVRHCINNFEIGLFEQVSSADKIDMVAELTQDIIDYNITTVTQLFQFVCKFKSSSYLPIYTGYISYFDKMCKAAAYEIKTFGRIRYIDDMEFINNRTGELLEVPDNHAAAPDPEVPDNHAAASDPEVLDNHAAASDPEVLDNHAAAADSEALDNHASPAESDTLEDHAAVFHVTPTAVSTIRDIYNKCVNSIKALDPNKLE